MPDKVGFSQADRALRIDTPLGKDVLLLQAISGEESLSQLFRFHLECLSEDDSIVLKDLVSKPVTVHLQRQDGEVCFHGIVSRFSQGGRDEHFTHYRVEMVPWLWFLSRTSDCRIFQNKTVPDIIQQIFKDLGFTDYKLRLHGSFRTWEYCVQYRETDLNFVCRLMEEEGIYYFFEHAPDGSKHTLIMANFDSAHEPCPGHSKIHCDDAEGGIAGEDVITEWRTEHELKPSKWAHTDYNFQTPSTNLMVNLQEKPGYEIYDFPGSYAKRDEGDTLARARLQEARAMQDHATGTSNCRTFRSGYTFDLLDHYCEDLNHKWLLTGVQHRASMSISYTSGGGGDESVYTNSFEAIPASVPYRAPRLTPKPVVQGCQSAVVVGPAGEEIFTDKYGRVKVQFHWDREGKKNQDSSCWVRVSYPWAGKNWGAIHIPRIGHEVLVDFLEGDPDQPIIIGRVYHAENMPPWALPGKAVISGIKSDSTKGGGGYNEYSMDDTKGKELIRVHAQKDQDITVLHDERTTIGHDRMEWVKHDDGVRIGHNRIEQVDNDKNVLIKHDQSETILNNKTTNVGGQHNEVVDGSMYVTVGKSLTETVALNYAETVGAGMEITVGGAMAITVGLAMAETVGGVKSESIGATKTETIGSNKVLNIGGDYSVNIGKGNTVTIAKDLAETIGGQHKSSITKEFIVNAKKVQVVASDEISLKTGSAELVMKKNGDITINGNKITIKGSGDVIIKGSAIKEN